MLGLLGLGIGVAFGWQVFSGGAAGPPLLAWATLLASYWLVYRWGKRGRGASATATAVAIATATADAASTSNAAVNVFVGVGAAGPGPQRLDALQAVSWRDDGADHQVEERRAAELESSADGDALDWLDPVDVIERVRRGEPVSE